jgi:hypothetical protein
MRIVVQNLQKQPGLAGRLIVAHSADAHPVDVFLAQEISIGSEPGHFREAHFTSKMGYGTAIYCRCGATDVRRMVSPTAELGGFIKKKITIAHCMGVECVSFHGYNGTPWRDVASLVAHIRAVLPLLRSPGTPCVFAGDFNTWTPAHLAAVSQALAVEGFTLARSWPYPGRDHPRDHVFLRGLRLVSSEVFASEADHHGLVMDVEICPPDGMQHTAACTIRCATGLGTRMVAPPDVLDATTAVETPEDS